MPRRTGRGHRRERRVNVFEQPEGGRRTVEDADLYSDTPEAELQTEQAVDAPSRQVAAVATNRRVRAQRVARQARARSDVFTRTLGTELRKIGILASAIVAVLIALTFVLD